MKIHIIGGGVIGLCSAWYLAQEGHEITVIDKTDLSDGTSHGNAGMVVPSHFVPLATPGVIAKGIRWMFDKRSPFFVKPRLNRELLQWIWQFYKACTPEMVDRAIPSLKHLNEWSRDLYREFATNPAFDFDLENKGLLMLYKDKKTAREEIEVAEKAHEMGLEAQLLSPTEVQQLETGVKVDVLGGVYYPEDDHLYPNTFMQQLVKELNGLGVKFKTGKSVVDINTSNGKVEKLLLSNGQTVPVEHLVLAGGSWSAQLLKKAGVKILLQDGKGYSMTYTSPTNRPSIPTILTEAKVAVTPMGSDLRIGGTLEISNFSEKIHKYRLEGILNSMPRYYPELTLPALDQKSVWQGYRPCTPDGLPYIGKSRKLKNLVVATGHAMMGMSMGPGTGKLVAQIMQDQPLGMEIDLFKVDRF
ncbi:MAG: FAD-dependent oxidoreductase [Bacteroidetes bacterium]|nr:MAG: FAD-dependent oxidoreductase [Bacteroidota bacterium]